MQNFTKSLVDSMVNRFLGWKLPKGFAPDAGISFKPTKPYEEPGWWPVGTNLFHAGQARDMIEHMLGDSLNQAARDVLAERRRQIEAEGWTPEHDDEHTGFELARAGACYAEYGNWPAHSEIPPNSWPWSAAWWKPTSYRQNLVKAAALILAEIERLDRIQPPKGKG